MLHNKYQESPVADEIMYYAGNDVNVHLDFALFHKDVVFFYKKNKLCALFWCSSSS